MDVPSKLSMKAKFLSQSVFVGPGLGPGVFELFLPGVLIIHLFWEPNFCNTSRVIPAVPALRPCNPSGRRPLCALRARGGRLGRAEPMAPPKSPLSGLPTTTPTTAGGGRGDRGPTSKVVARGFAVAGTSFLTVYR